MNQDEAIDLLVKRETNLLLAFPIKLYRVNIKDVSLELFHSIQYEIQKFEESKKIKRFQQWPENIKTTFSYDRPNNIMRTGLLEKLNKFIYSESQKYYTEFEQNYKLKITSSWINLYEKNDFQFRHTHLGDNNSVISGIYYHKTYPEGGELVFYNPMSSTHKNNIVYDIYEIKPEDGDLLFFPSFLGHRVNPNLSNNIRKTISFNMSQYEN